MKKLAIVLSLVGAVALALAAPATAATKKKVIIVKKPRTTTVYVVGKSYDGHLYVGKKRHKWHDKWYAYGVGPCWVKVGGVWFWNTVACS